MSGRFWLWASGVSLPLKTLRFLLSGLLQSAHTPLGGLSCDLLHPFIPVSACPEDRVGFWLWACVVDGNLFPPRTF